MKNQKWIDTNTIKDPNGIRVTKFFTVHKPSGTEEPPVAKFSGVMLASGRVFVYSGTHVIGYQNADAMAKEFTAKYPDLFFTLDSDIYILQKTQIESLQRDVEKQTEKAIDADRVAAKYAKLAATKTAQNVTGEPPEGFTKVPKLDDRWVHRDGRVCTGVGKMLTVTGTPGKVRVTINGLNTTRYVRDLVAATYLPNPHNLRYIYHRDGDQNNSSLSNLSWTNVSSWDKRPDKYCAAALPAGQDDF